MSEQSAPSGREEREERGLVRDQRGAIMVMGLASACLLIGALWFLIGVADTILWRDRMQEAVDAAAFSSATIHARGMNFVAAINLVLLALVTIHVTLGIVADALSIVAAICLIPPLDPAAPIVYRAATAVRKAQSGYDKFMWVANHTLNAAQTATAIVAPQLGTAAAMEVGAAYGATVISVGPSNVPFGMMIPGVKTEDNLSGLGGARLGLPVAFEPYSEMCKRPAYWALDWASERFKSFPVIAQTLSWITWIPLIGPKLASSVERIINEVFRGIAVILGKTVAQIECNSDTRGADELFKHLADMNVQAIDKIAAGMAVIKKLLPGLVPFGSEPDAQWDYPGGKKIWGSNATVKNGAPWFQLWAWTYDAKKSDVHERKVGVARRRYGDIGRDVPVKGSYIAQAEFYYDCGDPKAKWGSFACNGNISESHFTLYSMRWVARLKRVRQPYFAAFLADTIVAGLDGFDLIKKLLVKIPGIGQGEGSRLLYGVLDLEKIIRGAIDDIVLEPIGKLLGHPSPDAEIIH